MADVRAASAAKPIWIDLSTRDPGSARTFYSHLFGWRTEASTDPAFGGYTVAELAGRSVAGISPLQDDSQPTAWMVYMGTPDAAHAAARVAAAGGQVVAPPMEVGDQGRIAVFRDPSGAFFSVWEPNRMAGLEVAGEPGSFGWAELNARGLESVKPFYGHVFGWEVKTSPSGGGREYTEWQLQGESVAGGLEMPEAVPAQVPSFWMIYFRVGDVAEVSEQAERLGGSIRMHMTEYPGGRFSILGDPQGAVFGLVSPQ